MKRYLFLVILSLTLVSITAADVNHVVEFDREEIQINSSVHVECSKCPATGWNLQWQIPEDSEVEWVNGTSGEASDYSKDGGILSISTETPRQDSEIIDIGLNIDRNAEEVYDGLHKRTLSMPGLKNQETVISVQNDDILSAVTNKNFIKSYPQNEVRFKGQGPVNLKLNFGEPEETKYYGFFGKESNKSFDEAYEIAVGTLGLKEKSNLLPVVVMDDKRFNETYSGWSSGVYTSGFIALRENLGESFLPVLTQETAHAINQKRLNWDKTDSVYFDEGVASYSEYLMRKKLYQTGEIDVGPSEIFGEQRTYRTRKNGKGYIEIVNPRKYSEDLWGYYRDNNSWMKKWNQYRGSERRDFGYAYSQLVIRYHLMEGGNLSEIYSSMESLSDVEDPDRKWKFYSQQMDMEPCNYKSRDRFEECLDSINSYNYSIYKYSSASEGQEAFIEKESLPEPEKRRSEMVDNVEAEKISKKPYLERLKFFVEGIFSSIDSFLN